MNEKYYAHSDKEKQESEWQLLAEHLMKTAEIASSFCMNDDLRPFFRIAGLLHDLGKYQRAFQRYLNYLTY